MPKHNISSHAILSTTDSVRVSYDVYVGLDDDTREHKARCTTAAAVADYITLLQNSGELQALTIIPRIDGVVVENDCAA